VGGGGEEEGGEEEDRKTEDKHKNGTLPRLQIENLRSLARLQA
jgi:hypothetical protein